MYKPKGVFSFFVVLLISIEVSLIFITIFVDFNNGADEKEIYFLNQKDARIDTLIRQMSLDEKIGQLFMLELNDAKSEFKEKLDTLNQQFHIGGIKFKQTEVLNQLIITNYLQSKSELPLFIGSEGSLINRKDFNLPIGVIINAVDDSSFANYYLHHFTKVLSLEGVNIEFSNSINVLDTIKQSSGFSGHEQLVIKQAINFRKKLHKTKIISCLNFSDSLFFCIDTLAIDTLCQLKKPFLIDRFFALQVPQKAVNKIGEGTSPYQLSQFNKKKYGFQGLLFSPIEDSLSAESIKRIFESGTDVFVVKNELEPNIKSFKTLVENNQIFVGDIDRRVKRILLAKKWFEQKPVPFKSAEISLSKILSEKRMLLSWKLYESSFTLLKNRNNILPFENLLNSRTHLLTIGKENFLTLKEHLSYYMDFSSSVYEKNKLNSSSLRYSKNLIIAIDNSENSYLTDSILIKSLLKLNETKNLIVISHGDIKGIRKLAFADVLLYTYDNHPFFQANIAQTIAGAIRPKGKMLPELPVALSEKPNFKKISRFRYTIPEAAGFNSYQLRRIDSLVEKAIYLGATPGAQILAAKNGKVFFYKSYGYQTYGKHRKVKNSDIYDLASISKVAATTLAAMRLYEMDSIHLEDSIKYYIDDTINCTIKNHQLADFFIHKTGMPADMPILQYISYRDSLTGRYDKYYAEKKDSAHTIKVADNYYLREDYLDSVSSGLYNLEIDTVKPYLYSDINFNIIYDILLRKLPVSYKRFVYSNFYRPLQLRTIGYLPIEQFNKYRIAPTQKDRYWRKDLLRGMPHDESAALYGGISGNAGLFSNANDLAILFQMLANGGTYAGKRIFKKETVEKFTLPQTNSKRGLGFNRKDGGFGHSGFTGCVVWANPNTDFVFVFLSNSIHPRATNRKLKRMKIRSKVYDLMWEAYEPGSTKLDFAKLE